MATSFIYCPKCKNQLAQRSGITEKPYDIGPEYLNCKKCGLKIKSGAKEWDAYDIYEKAPIFFKHYIYSFLLIGPLLSFMAGGFSVFLIIYLLNLFSFGFSFDDLGFQIIAIIIGGFTYYFIVKNYVNEFKFKVHESRNRKRTN